MPEENQPPSDQQPAEENQPQEVQPEAESASAESPSDKPVNPEMEAVSANQNAEEAEASVEQARADLNESLEKGKEAAETPAEAPQAEAPVAEAPAAETPEPAEMHPAAPEEPAPEPAKEEAPAPAETEEKKEKAATEAKSTDDKSEKIKGKKVVKKSAAPKKIGKEKSKRKSNARFLLTIAFTFIFLFIAFIVLMVLVIAGGGQNSAILSSFGIDASGIKNFLLTIVNLSFGFLALLFFVIAVIGVFRIFMAKKGDKEAKKKGIKMSIFGTLPFFLMVFIWLFLFNFIGSIKIAAEQVRAEIVVLSPENLEGVQAPLEVTYSAENVIKSLLNSDFQLDGARWDLDGDGNFETEMTEQVVSYLYNRRGTYEVGVEVDVVGEEEEGPRQFFYTLVIGEAVFDAAPSEGTAPLEVQFNATSILPPGAKVQSLDWDFDSDGTYELTGKDNVRPRYTFEKIGVWSVHLRIVDVNNLVENYYRDIEIIPGDRPNLIAEIEVSPGLTGVIPLQIRFDGGRSTSAKGKIVNYEWDFGDGSNLQEGKSVSHIFNEPGYYTISLKVIEDSGKDTSNTIEVHAIGISSEPEAKIQTIPPADAEGVLTGDIPFKINFDGSGSEDPDGDIVDYEWDFDVDGGQTGQNAEFTFEEAGTYAVTLLVRDSEGQESTAVLSVEVTEPGVKSVITAIPEEGTAPLTVDFDGSTSSTFNGKIVSYEWDFGDDSPPTITSAKITHKYNNVGSYTVFLKVTTNQNESAVGELLVYVREIPLKACFEPSRHSGEAPLAVTFDSKCSTGAVSNYKWDFGDGANSESRKPAHNYEEPGIYNVTLEVSDDKNNVNSFSDVIVAEGEVE